jgi:GntR family transcriptional regulator / MocR family aminotransferase
MTGPLIPHIQIDKASETPVYLQISGAIVQLIRIGRLKKGLRLPGSRELGEQLGVNRMTAVAAYEELEAQGWVTLELRKGAFVKINPPVSSPRKIVEVQETYTIPAQAAFNFVQKSVLPAPTPEFPLATKLVLNDGYPDPRLAPMEELLRSIRSLARKAANQKYLMPGGAQGTHILRETLATYLSDTRGLGLTAENILITKGAQMGLYLSAELLIKPGDGLISGEPGYAQADLTFQRAGAKVYPVKVDAEGVDVDQIERLCKTKQIRAVYVIPHHHHPTTSTLSPERRVRLLELANTYGFALIEDDYDYDFHYAGKQMMPIASLDRKGNVIYVGSLTKSLAPAIRYGFIVAPVNFIRSATYLRKFIDAQGDSLVENAVAALYQDGTIGRHLKKSLKLYKDRRDHFCKLLQQELNDHIEFRIPDGGMAVWAKFLHRPLPEVVEAAHKRGLVMSSGTDYDRGNIKYNSTCLGFAALNEAEQVKVISILKEVLQ